MITIFIVLIIVFLGIVSLYLIHKKNMELLCSVSSPKRGTRAERRLIIKMLRNNVDPKTIFHDLYVRRRNLEFSQVDLVVVTPQGLIAIEVKDYSGWIFGNEYQRSWTQVLNYGQDKYRFYNPIMQNSGHISALREQSQQFDSLPIFNVVLFTRRCRLKNVSYKSSYTYVGYTSDIMSIIKWVESFGNFYYKDKKEISRILSCAVKRGDVPGIASAHSALVKTKYLKKSDDFCRTPKRGWGKS